MKTITRLLVLGSLLLSFNLSKSQTTFSIDTAYIDSTLLPVITSCPNSWHYYYVEFDLSGYTPGSTFKLIANWGSGIIDTQTVYVQGSGSPQWTWPRGWSINNLPVGTYRPQFIGIAPDGKRDTVLSWNTLVITPCGNISGNVYFDANNNCVRNSGEYSARWLLVELENKSNGQKYYARTDTAGDYSINVPNGTYDLKLNSQLFSQYCPIGGHTNVSTNTSGLDFGIQCGTGFDLTGVISGAGFRPGFARHFYVTPYNSTCNAQNGEIKVILSDSRITYQSSTWGSTPTRVNGDTVVFSFTNLSYLNQNWRYNNNWFRFHVKTDTTANIGDTICMEMEIVPINGDNDTTNNRKTYCFPVSNSFDPNDKQGQPLGIGPDNIIDRGQNIEYTIRFQNTGNDIAYKVVLKDTLPEEMDLSTLQMLGSSHEYDMYVGEDRLLKFTFNDISLPDSASDPEGSQGFVTFKMSQVPNLPYGTDIENKAYIYFDYNKPIITNTSHHRVDIIDGIDDFGNLEEAQFSLYPNPTDGITLIKRNNNQPAVINVYSVTGKVVLQLQSNQMIEQLSTDKLNSGIYFVEVLDGSREIKKLIIR